MKKTKNKTKNREKALAVLIAALGLGTVQAAWEFVDGKLTNGNPKCSFPAQVVTLTDGAGSSVKGLQLTGTNEFSTEKVDFTEVETHTKHKVISVAATNIARNCREFIAPDMFDLSLGMFFGNKSVTNITLSPKVACFPTNWARQTPLRTLNPGKFPNAKSFEYKCFSSCTNFQVDIGSLIDPGVTNIGRDAFYNVPVTGKLEVTNLQNIGAYAFSFEKLSAKRGKFSNLESVKLAGTLEEIPLQCFKAAINLKEVDLSGCTVLRSIGDEAFSTCINLTSDVARIVNRAVTKIGSQAFANTAIAGKLVLTNVQRIGASAFHIGYGDPAKKYKGEPRLTAVDLSGKQIEIKSAAFCNQTKLQSLVVGTKNFKMDTASSSPFVGCTSLTNIWIKGPALTTEEVAYIVTNAPGLPKCIIYASMNLPPANATGWLGLAVSATKEELKQLSEPNRLNCFGVYKTKKGKRKAFFVHRRSPFEGGNGVLIIVR